MQIIESDDEAGPSSADLGSLPNADLASIAGQQHGEEQADVSHPEMELPLTVLEAVHIADLAYIAGQLRGEAQLDDASHDDLAPDAETVERKGTKEEDVPEDNFQHASATPSNSKRQL